MRNLIAVMALVLISVYATGCENDVDRIREANQRATDEDLKADLSVFDLERGDCIGGALGDEEIESVEIVPCTSRRAEYRVASILTTRESGAYPGDRVFQREASRRCPSDTDSFLFPTRDSWSAGDRVLTCLELVR